MAHEVRGVEGEVRSTDAQAVLAVDVGNTSTSFGLFGTGADALAEPLGTWEVTTPQRLTPDEARMQARQVLACLLGDVAGGMTLPAFGGGEARGHLAGTPVPMGAILSCVVPSLSAAWEDALRSLCPGGRALVVGPGLRTGLPMRYKDPSEVGPDRIADVLAAREAYGSPVVVVDFGTTMNIEVIDAAGAFDGGIIAPGLALGATALSRAAARLPVIELRAPERAIGRSTREAMQSGVVLGEVARVDGLLDRVFSELGQAAPVVLTGDHAGQLSALLAHEVRVDETLTLRGLHQLFLSNAGRGGQRQRRA